MTLRKLPTCLLAILVLSQTPAEGDAPFPARPIQIMAPASPGGGWDQTARAIQEALVEITDQHAVVYNIPGAGGTIGLAQFAHDQAGDPHQWMVGGLVMLGATIANRSPVGLDRVTPIASMTAEWETIVVPVDSKYQTFQQLLADFKKNPTGIRWGGGSAGGSDHILVGLIARKAGISRSQVNYIAYSGGGEALIALLSGALTAGVSGISEFRDQVDAGLLRRLAVSSEERIEGINTPTLVETGIPVTLANWRAVFAPPGLSAGQRASVVDLVEAMRSTESWQQSLRRRDWSDFFKTGDAFSAYLEQERIRVETISLREGYSVIGPGFFPGIVAPGLLTLIALCLLRATVFPGRKPHPSPEVHKPEIRRPAIALAALIVYAAALGPLGYIAATALFFPAVAYILGSRRFRRDLLLGIALSFAIHLLFTRLLGTRLPGGLLESLLPAMG